eukprot:tig00000113_g5593.t1
MLSASERFHRQQENKILYIPGLPLRHERPLRAAWKPSGWLFSAEDFCQIVTGSSSARDVEAFCARCGTAPSRENIGGRHIQVLTGQELMVLAAKEGHDSAVGRSLQEQLYSPEFMAFIIGRGELPADWLDPLPPSSSVADRSVRLFELFSSFASFGKGKEGSEFLDSSQFAKLCKDAGLVDENFPMSSVDMIFTKVKKKHERKIDYGQFVASLRLIAEEKYFGDPTGLQRLFDALGALPGPAKHSTRVAAKGVFAWLTDVRTYTARPLPSPPPGVYKERFNEDGTGKGVPINGDCGPGNVKTYRGGVVRDLSQIVRPDLRH